MNKKDQNIKKKFKGIKLSIKSFTILALTLLTVTFSITFCVNNVSLNKKSATNNINNGNNNNQINVDGDNNNISVTDDTKRWTLTVLKNVGVQNTCYVCKTIFVPEAVKTNYDSTDLGYLIYSDIPFPLKIDRINDSQIKNITIYSITEDYTTALSYNYNTNDELKNSYVEIPYKTSDNKLVMGISSTGTSYYKSDPTVSASEALYSKYDPEIHKKIVEPLKTSALKSKLELTDLNKHNPIYLGLLQYYNNDAESSQNFPSTSYSPTSFTANLEPKIAFYLIEVEDTNSKSDIYLYGTKILYDVNYNFDVSKGDNVEYILLNTSSILNDDVAFKNFIIGENDKKLLNETIKLQLKNIDSNKIGLNSAKSYYKDDKVNEDFAEKKYKQIVNKINELKN